MVSKEAILHIIQYLPFSILKSNFSGRYECVKMNNAKSDNKAVLGPALFQHIKFDFIYLL